MLAIWFKLLHIVFLLMGGRKSRRTPGTSLHKPDTLTAATRGRLEERCSPYRESLNLTALCFCTSVHPSLIWMLRKNSQLHRRACCKVFPGGNGFTAIFISWSRS